MAFIDQVEAEEARAWREYDMAARWCAERGLTGERGSKLPFAMTVRVVELIDDDPDAFSERVRAMAYARAMQRTPAHAE